jgi:hypothetical protein
MGLVVQATTLRLERRRELAVHLEQRHTLHIAEGLV